MSINQNIPHNDKHSINVTPKFQGGRPEIDLILVSKFFLRVSMVKAHICKLDLRDNKAISYHQHSSRLSHQYKGSCVFIHVVQPDKLHSTGILRVKKKK